MKKLLAVLLSFCMLFCLAACGTNNTSSDDISNNDVSETEKAPEHVVIPQFIGLTKAEAENLATSLGLKVNLIDDTYSADYEDGKIIKQSSEKDVVMIKGATITLTVNNAYYKHFNFKLIDHNTTVWHTQRLGGGVVPEDPTVEHLEKGTYILASLNKDNLPTNLQIPETYNGVRVTAVFRRLLDGTSVETITFPKTITAVGGNLCGDTCNCPSLKNIICLGDNPFYLGSFSLDNNQLAGGCKIYVPDSQINVYKTSEIGEIPFKSYADLIVPISTLDENIKN